MSARADRHRTGLRKPPHRLKAWAGTEYQRRITPRLRAAMVDEDRLSADDLATKRKSWYVAITQDRDLTQTLGPVHGLPKRGHTMLLFEDDVIALVEYLIDINRIAIANDGTITNEPAALFAEWLKRTRERKPRAAK